MWAWIWDAMTPVIFTALALIGFANEGHGGGGFLGKAVVIGTALIAPIIALVLGVKAHGEGERSGLAAAIVAGVLVIAMPIALYLFVI
jgi:hypothetical protein